MDRLIARRLALAEPKSTSAVDAWRALETGG